MRSEAPLAIHLRYLVTFSFASLVALLSLTPGRSGLDDTGFVWLVAITPTPIQKLMHLLVYAALAALWVWTLRGGRRNRRTFLLALALAFGEGALLEWAQVAIPGRFGTLVDVLINAAGAACGLLAARLWLRRRAQRHPGS